MPFEWSSSLGAGSFCAINWKKIDAFFPLGVDLREEQGQKFIDAQKGLAFVFNVNAAVLVHMLYVDVDAAAEDRFELVAIGATQIELHLVHLIAPVHTPDSLRVGLEVV